MAWSTPLTAVSNSPLTAAQWNASVRDNLLETAVAKATVAGSLFVGTGMKSIAERVPDSVFIGTTESTSSTSYGDLTTVGPSVSIVTGVTAIVILNCRMWNGTANQSALMSFDISGASAVSSSDVRAMKNTSGTVNEDIDCSKVIYFVGLTPGTNVFTAKYRATGGSAAFGNRRLDVIPL